MPINKLATWCAFMDSGEISFKHFKIATLIYTQWLDERDPDAKFNKQMAKSAERGRKLGETARAKLKKEKERYYNSVKDYAKKQNSSRFEDVLPLHIYNPLISPEISHTTHTLRQAEERYLLHLHKIEDTGSTVENWALIGMALSEAGDESPFNILFPRPKEKRGRRKTGLGIDYRRAVWKLLLEDCTVTMTAPDGEEYSYSSSNLFTLNELLDVFLFELNDATIPESQHAFEEIESRLKLKSVSRDTLITSFSRGEKERREMWDS